GRHLLRRDLARPRRRGHQRRFPPERCSGDRAAARLPDLRRRVGVEVLQGRRHRVRQGQQRRTPPLARKFECRGPRPLQAGNTQTAARLRSVRIEWFATEKGFTMFTRENCAAIAHEQPGGYSLGSTGVMTEAGFSYLLYREGRAVFAAHGGAETP